NYYSNSVSVLIGNGDGSFQAPVSYAVGPGGPSGVDFLAVGDLNKDGIPDIVAANEGSSTLSVLLGNGNGTFATEVIYATNYRPHGVGIGDIDGDGNPDVVVADWGTDSVSVFEGNGSGTLGSPASYAVGINPYMVALADLNGDGHIDIVATDQNSY